MTGRRRSFQEANITSKGSSANSFSTGTPIYIHGLIGIKPHLLRSRSLQAGGKVLACLLLQRMLIVPISVSDLCQNVLKLVISKSALRRMFRYLILSTRILLSS